MAVMALDWGQRYVGYASADPEGLVVTPRGHYERKVRSQETWTLTRADSDTLAKIFEEWEVTHLVLGLPLNADASPSASSRGAQRLAELIRERFAIPVTLVDERLTSWEADSNADGRDQHEKAAAIILRTFFTDGANKSSPRSDPHGDKT